jgi:hypothetical protein
VSPYADWFSNLSPNVLRNRPHCGAKPSSIVRADKPDIATSARIGQEQSGIIFKFSDASF